MATKGLFQSSIGRKLTMSITGLFLCSFLIVHLLGNLPLLSADGQITFNEYTKFMTTNGFIRIMEIVLFAGFIIHIIDAVMITRANKKARPTQYAMDKKQSSWYSRNMGMTGSLILAFLVLHLATFFVKYKFGSPGIDPAGNKDMYTIVIEAFSQKWYSIVYILCMLVLGMHLNHGFQSAFQTIGINHSKYSPVIKKSGTAFALLITIAYISFPVFLGFIK